MPIRTIQKHSAGYVWHTNHDNMALEKLFNDLTELSEKSEISKTELIETLRKYTIDYSVFDLMKFNFYMIDDTEYVPDEFYKEVHKVNFNFVSDFIRSINDKTMVYEGNIEINSFRYSLEFLTYKWDSEIHKSDLLQLGILGTLYHRFIVEKPIHPLDLPFPGNLKIVYDNGQYFCPARKNNLKNPVAYCKMCLCQELKF